jgi:hypothetical protein
MKLILDGHIPVELQNQPPHATLLLDHLSDMQKLSTINSGITFEEFVKGMIKWNERTTTSPSGQHLGHFKVLTRLQIRDETNEEISLSTTLLDLYYKVAMTAANLGKSLDRWGEISTCMIEKIIGVPRIDKLRVIHLFEADFNMLLKIMWARKCVWQMSDLSAINEGQAGSRPGKRAIDVVIQKEMKYLYATTTRTLLETIDNDAKSCYDCMICNFSMALSYYYGVPRNYCSMLASNLRNSKYNIKTGLGESTETYQHTTTTPIHGTGQGSCASPALWLMSSSFMMEIMEKYGHGMYIDDVIETSEEIRQFMEGFVDDVSNYAINNYYDDNLTTLINTLQNDGKLWAGLLASCGGKLELTKCFYYLLSWQWDKYGNPTPQNMQQQNLPQNTINIAPEGQPPQFITQRDIIDSHKTLGAYKTINGNEIDHIQYLHNKSDTMIDLLGNGQLNRQQARIAYNCI